MNANLATSGDSAFDRWAKRANLLNEQNLADIGHPTEGPVIGIEVTHFLEDWYHPQREFLHHALGGFPLAFERVIVRTVEYLQNAGINVCFFFDGLDTAYDGDYPDPSVSLSTKTAKAFTAYDEAGDAERTGDLFNLSGPSDTKWLSVALKCVLQNHDIPFVVAPFKAQAQLQHHLSSGTIDGVYGSSELFLYGVERVITQLKIPEQNGTSNGQSETASISFLDLDQCMQALGCQFDTLQNAMLLSGTRSLPRFPPLEAALTQPEQFKDIVTGLDSLRGNVLQFVERFPIQARGNWWEKYEAAYQSITHMIVHFDYKTVKPRSQKSDSLRDRPPSDIHEIIGLQLPSELHHYIFQGMIGVRVLNWVINGKIRTAAPLTGRDTPVYRGLIAKQLLPMRQQALALITYTLTRYYQRKEFVVQIWSQGEYEDLVKFNTKDLSSPKKSISAWRIHGELFTKQVAATKKQYGIADGCPLFVAIAALKDTAFVPKTISSSTDRTYLNSVDEIVHNALWRVLQLRGYTNEKHELTAWGEVLFTALSNVAGSSEQVEAVFIAVELLRLGLLNREILFPADFKGTLKHGSEIDKLNGLLIAHVVSTGKLEHRGSGYVGPLSNHLLAYHSLVTEVRLTLRDLVEMILVTMFLEDEVQRVRTDYVEIARALPFRDHPSAGLAVLIKTYLDELQQIGQPNMKDNQVNIEERCTSEWFRSSDVRQSLSVSYRIWTAVSSAVKSAPAGTVTTEQKQAWQEVETWAKPRLRE